MSLPAADLTTNDLDANSDSLTAARVELKAAVDKTNTLLGEGLALLDEAETFTAKKTFTSQNTPIELRGVTSDGCYIPLHPDVSSPATVLGQIGFIASAILLSIKSLVTNGHIDFETDGSGEVRVNGNRILTTADGGGTPSDGTVNRVKLDTGTQSLSGSVSAGVRQTITLSNPYAFFPMIHHTTSSGAVLIGSTVDSADPDIPKFGIFNPSGGGASLYDVDYRYVDA